MNLNPSDNARWRLAIRSEWQFTLVLIAGALILGYGATVLEPLFYRRPMVLAAIPILMIGVASLVISLEWSFLALIFVRAGMDPILEGTKVGAAGGAGALLNLAIVAIALFMLIRRPTLVPRHVYVTWLPFLLLTLAGTAHAPERLGAVKLWLNWLTVASVFWIAVYLIACGRSVESLLKVVAFGSLIPAAVALASIALRRSAPIEPGADVGDGFRLAGSFPHPNIHAFYLLLIISLTLFFWNVARTGQKRSWTWGAYLLVLLGFLLLTKTRSAWAASVFILLFYGWKFDRRLLLFMIIAAPLIAIGVPSIRERLLDLQGTQYALFAKLNSYEWRQLLWRSAFDSMSPKDWIVGRGLNSFDFYSLTFFPLAGGIQWGAHNVYVQLLYDGGIIGLLAYAWAYVVQLRFFKPMWQAEPRKAFLLAATVVSALIVGYSDNMLRYLVYNIYLWFIVGVVAAPTMLKLAAGARERQRLTRRVSTWN